jgi:hypothetical protein
MSLPKAPNVLRKGVQLAACVIAFRFNRLHLGKFGRKPRRKDDSAVPFPGNGRFQRRANALAPIERLADKDLGVLGEAQLAANGLHLVRVTSYPQDEVRSSR